MSCSLRILSTHRVDSSPSVLLVSPDGSKIIVNCGEGCQRQFLEFGQKISTVNRVCLTHLSHDSIGGLPGMILTTSDVVASAMENAKAAIKPGAKQNAKAATKPESKTESSSRNNLHGIDVIGPSGTQKFMLSLRHFMRRDAFEVRVREGSYFQNSGDKIKKRKQKGTGNEGSFHVQSIACVLENSKESILHPRKRLRTEGSNQVLSFVFTTPPIQGKFLVDKAKALGIPPGPLYRQLKSGNSIKFQNKQGEEQTVESAEVVEPGSPGVAIAVLYYPTLEVCEQLCASETLNKFKQRSSEEAYLELIVHMAPRDIFSLSDCRSWRETFGRDVQHVFLETDIPIDELQRQTFDTGTPFHAATAGAHCRAQLSTEIYGTLALSEFTEDSKESTFIQDNGASFVKARPLLEYVLMPRSKKGFCNSGLFGDKWTKVKSEADTLLQTSGAANLAGEILQNQTPISAGCQGEIIFTGTGSAVPCKHRNVSGIYVRMENRKAMLLDVGEGTIGQLLRAKHTESYSDIMKDIKAVWISHPHADHHLGILRLLTERKRITSDPLVLIAPPNLLGFLEEYAAVDSLVRDSFIFMDCRDISTKAQEATWSEAQVEHHSTIMNRLKSDLNIASCTAIPVAHCPHSYAVVLHGTSFGSLAYSGDCRPSVHFANAARNADLLIHESTFADGMEAEAIVKRHSTVGEALRVGKQMKAKTIVLTHFSQRYPKVPPVSTDDRTESNKESSPVIFAFDFMKLTPATLIAASKITPALRLLYPETEKSETNEQTSAIAALEVPGLFAQKDLL